VLSSLRKNDDGIDRVHDLVLRLHLLSGRDTLQGYFPALGRFVDLPNYPWQRERHWLPDTNEGYHLIERKRIHPLLGWPLKDAPAGWENILDPRTQTWLADHSVGGAVVLPGAAYIEMALAAAREWFGSETLELEELDIVSPVVFDGEHGRSIRLDINPRDGSFQIRSRQRLSDDDWGLNASGRLLGAVSGYVESVGLPVLSPEETLGREIHYRLAHTLGLDYGPVFQGMSEAKLAGNVLEGKFAAPVNLGLDDSAWLLHPAIVDVAFQSLLDFFRQEIEAGVGLPLLPIKLGRLRLLRSAPITHFRTSILRRSLRSVLADFELFAADGEQVAVLTACRFRAAALRQDKVAEPACWEVTPIVQPSSAVSASSLLPEVRTLVQKVGDWFVDQEGELKRNTYFGEVQPLFDALVTAFAYEAMQALFTKQKAEAQAWLDEVGFVSDDQCKLFCWVRNLLVEQAYLVCDNKGWSIADSDMPPAAEIWRTLVAEYSEGMPELLLMGRMGRALHSVLAGEINSTTLTAQIASSHQLEALFDDSITYSCGRHAIEQLLELLSSRLSPCRRLRILEVSPGVSEIPRSIGHRINTPVVDYVLAHQDPSICDHLRHEYQDDEWIAVAELETTPPVLKSQAVLPAAYDVVVFRHALSEFQDPHSMLLWAHQQLAAGGLIVLAERYADLATDLLWGKNRLLPPQTWCSALAGIGFVDIEVCREPSGEGSPVGAYLVLAKHSDALPVEALPEPARWLLLADDQNGMDVIRAVQQSMATSGQVAVCTQYGESFRTREKATALLGSLQLEFDGVFDHVLLLASEHGQNDIDLSCDALNLVQELGTAYPDTRLYFVTRGGVPVDGLFNADRCNPAHAALWGFGRVVMNEFPGLSCKLIDLPDASDAMLLADLLADELLHPDAETEIVLQAKGRHALRMHRTQVGNSTRHGQVSKRFRLDFRVPGQLRNLVWLEQPEHALAADEIEVRPVATGLNFRDIMYVMGLLPDEAVEHGFAGASLGLEFSGVVTRVGSRVDEYVPGDPVMGFGSACFASHVVTRANAVTPKPEDWSFEAAATVPTVFFTVYYALKQLANLQAGERVLIHGAAGGVGIAAVQFARHLGAEVFATAGSEEKREFVTLLGADHVFDSRNLAFADQILAVTDGEGVDVVLNSLAGEAIRRNLHILRPFGRFLELGKRDFFENTPIGLRPFKDNISYFGIDADQLLIARPDLAGRLFREVMGLFRAGVLSPLPVRSFPAERVIDAFRYMQQAKQIGKVVVSFDGACISPQPILSTKPNIGFERDAAYLVTGGVSGFGLQTALWLAQHGAGQLVLLSRRGLDTPGACDAVASIQALGAQAIVIACDVTDHASLAGALQHEGLMPLKGIFHAAMVIDDALISNLDSERMSRVLVPKIKGGWNLHELTQSLSLDYFMLYSSVTTYIGNPGQGNYVAGNAWFEGLAVLRRALGLPVTCIGWGPIGDAGYLTRNQTVKDSLASRLGAEPLSSASALRMLGHILAVPHSNLAVADFQWSVLARLLPSAQGPRFGALRRHGDVVVGTEGLEDFRDLIQGKSLPEVQMLVRQLVTQEVAQILSIAAERIDSEKSLHDLGLDSLMGVELALSLEKRFGVQIPAMMLNEGPTVERVATRIIERLTTDDAVSESDNDLTAMAINMAAQHAVSREVMEAAVADIEEGRSDE